MEVEIFTDGACRGNPGPGGWGALLLSGERVRELCGGEKDTTNNRMELTAVIEALRLVAASPAWAVRPVSVFTDSQYVQKGISQWISGWKRNGWRTAAKDPVKNQDLWVPLDEIAGRLNPRWVWVKGHAGIHYNEVCDQLTQDEIAKHR